MVLMRSETQMENLLVQARKNYKVLTEVVPKSERNEKVSIHCKYIYIIKLNCKL